MTAVATRRRRLYWWREVLYILAFYGVYSLVRNRGLNDNGIIQARHNALRVIRVENFLHSFHEAWVQHLLHLDVTVEPVSAIEDRDWRWFVGLDAEATQIGNALWTGEDVDPEMQSRLLALFKLAFLDETFVEPRVAGHPVYMLLAMTPDKIVRVKPQNLIVGLPVVRGVQAA